VSHCIAKRGSHPEFWETASVYQLLSSHLPIGSCSSAVVPYGAPYTRRVGLSRWAPFCASCVETLLIALDPTAETPVRPIKHPWWITIFVRDTFSPSSRQQANSRVHAAAGQHQRRTWAVPTVFPLFHSTEQPIILAVPITQ